MARPAPDTIVAPAPLPAHRLAGRAVVVVSPHLDDAVLSCGALMSVLDVVTVVSVFAGDAVDWEQLRPWDEACGFSAGTNVVRARIEEDDRALRCIGATGLRLGFLDGQYRTPSVSPGAGAIGALLLTAIRRSRAAAALMPLGLAHPDHRLAAEAAVWAASRSPDIEWFAYQDLPYAYEGVGVAEAIAALDELTPQPVSIIPTPGLDRKAAALDEYRSQLIGLGPERCGRAMRPERYWKLNPPGVRA